VKWREKNDQEAHELRKNPLKINSPVWNRDEMQALPN
jgi:hypothetical protein